MDRVIKEKGYAKINLSLDVLRRKDDGYHEVKMIMQTVDLYDELTFEAKPDPDITLKVLNIPVGADLGPLEKNLIYRAAKIILDEAKIDTGVTITLDKHIPVAAGMAGGSTDAAATLRGLNKLFDLNYSDEHLKELGVKLGADVPYCINGGTQLSEGIGEILTPIAAPPSNAYILIAKPDIAVSTKFVYENLHANTLSYHPDVDGMIKAMENKDLRDMASKLGNVLETVTVKEYPIIKDIKDTMLNAGALGSLMSGSGPTVFGLFDDESKARAAASQISDTGLAKEIFVTNFVFMI